LRQNGENHFETKAHLLLELWEELEVLLDAELVTSEGDIGSVDVDGTLVEMDPPSWVTVASSEGVVAGVSLDPTKEVLETTIT
jgi:hypothetical protein